MIYRLESNFADRVLEFHSQMKTPRFSDQIVSVLTPKLEQTYLRQFLKKFYWDNRARLAVFGINPGRFGGGSTGISFTDPVSLTVDCDIPNELPQRREVSSQFIYGVVARWGGPTSFYGDVFLTAICPLGLVRAGKNFNYYDSSTLFSEIRPYLVDTIQKQMTMGIRRDCVVVIGSGKNSSVFKELNHELGLFKKVFVLEHPRFIMQYQRSRLEYFLEKYESTFREALRHR